MSQSKGKKKKVVVTTSKKKDATLMSTTSKFYGNNSEAIENHDLLFGKKNFMYMFVGIGLIALGMILMSGGHMPNDNVWDSDLIYSWRRTVLAPIVILAGLGLQIYAIFVKK